MQNKKEKATLFNTTGQHTKLSISSHATYYDPQNKVQYQIAITLHNKRPHKPKNAVQNEYGQQNNG